MVETIILSYEIPLYLLFFNEKLGPLFRFFEISKNEWAHVYSKVHTVFLEKIATQSVKSFSSYNGTTMVGWVSVAEVDQDVFLLILELCCSLTRVIFPLWTRIQINNRQKNRVSRWKFMVNKAAELQWNASVIEKRIYKVKHQKCLKIAISR